MRARTALVLAGHGSHISPDTAGLVWSYVDQLRAWGVADEITAAFWKEQPTLRQVMRTLTADHAVVVPVFTAQGFFTRQVIPAEMNLDGVTTMRKNRVIHYARTLGEHPQLKRIVRETVCEVMRVNGWTATDTAVALIGHGTRRSKNSRGATREQVEFLRGEGIAAEVVDVYLDDEPAIPTLYQATTAPHVVAVPFFLAPGSHVTVDVPDALGVTVLDQPQRVGDRTVHYTRPVGTHDTVCQLIFALAQETGAPIMQRTNPAISSWAHFPRAGAQTLIQAVQNGTMTSFGELVLSPSTVTSRNGDHQTLVHSPAQLRAMIRENPFRSLSTARGLPGGWSVPLESIDDLPAVVETVYPGAVAAWAKQQAGELHGETLTKVSHRQQGMFKGVDVLPEGHLAMITAQVCGECVLTPIWRNVRGPLPCVSPCNHWLSAAVEEIA